MVRADARKKEQKFRSLLIRLPSRRNSCNSLFNLKLELNVNGTVYCAVYSAKKCLPTSFVINHMTFNGFLSSYIIFFSGSVVVFGWSCQKKNTTKNFHVAILEKFHKFLFPSLFFFYHWLRSLSSTQHINRTIFGTHFTHEYSNARNNNLIDKHLPSHSYM